MANRISQEAGEVLAAGSPAARLSQIAGEVAWVVPTSRARVSQVIVEVLQSATILEPRPAAGGGFNLWFGTWQPMLEDCDESSCSEGDGAWQ
jgi:hypothetical protein